MAEIRHLIKKHYFIPWYKRLFMSKECIYINSESDTVEYYRSFGGDVEDNILIDYYLYRNKENNEVIGHKLRITSSADVIGFHLAQSKKVINALHWLWIKSDS